jgi:hypothetical protein
MEPQDPTNPTFVFVDQPPMTPEQLAAASQVVVGEPEPAVFVEPPPPMTTEAVGPTLAEQYPRLAAMAATADADRERELAEYDAETCTP